MRERRKVRRQQKKHKKIFTDTPLPPISAASDSLYVVAIIIRSSWHPLDLDWLVVLLALNCIAIQCISHLWHQAPSYGRLQQLAEHLAVVLDLSLALLAVDLCNTLLDFLF
jgi:hypothetical protein